MSQLPSRAAMLAAPLPLDGMVSAAQAPPVAIAGADALETTAIGPSVAAQDAREPAATTASKTAVAAAKDTAPVVGTATSPDASAPADASSADITAQAAPTTPAFVGKPATTAATAHLGKPATVGQSPAGAGSIGGALFALVLVVGLILALGWVARRMPGFRAGGRHSALRVVDSLTLGPRERVVVVAVGNTQLLLGVGAGGTRTLHTLAEPLPVAESGTTPAFAQLLAQHFGKKA